ncbi:uncharacterized protein LOC129581290 [Paramacrobiotus metropolitanus]|uniref:uncharacterized protein LOC129581290 n=1 Tax=Paramacrobiotus metropolitanus TaxID=2943436 RepID=UPI002445B958|nr:uncharacterized protein LOC129581290 [Paramacrobiotus metropolitanus]
MESNNGSALVFFHEAEVQPAKLFSFVAAVPLQNLKSLHGGLISEKTVCLGKHRNVESRCIVLHITKGKTVEELRVAELSAEREEMYEDKGRRWADELKQQVAHTAPKPRTETQKKAEQRKVTRSSFLAPASSPRRGIHSPYPTRYRDRLTAPMDEDAEECFSGGSSPMPHPYEQSSASLPNYTLMPLKSSVEERSPPLRSALRQRGRSVASMGPAHGSRAERLSIVRGSQRRRAESETDVSRLVKKRASHQFPKFCGNLFKPESPAPKIDALKSVMGVPVGALQVAIGNQPNVSAAFTLALHTLFSKEELANSSATPGGARSTHRPLIDQERLAVAVGLVRDYCANRRCPVPNDKSLSRVFGNAKKVSYQPFVPSAGSIADVDEEERLTDEESDVE